MTQGRAWNVALPDDPERAAILAAMTRILAGQTTRKLTVKDLADEAGLKRHHLANKHTDLKDLFYAELERSSLQQEPPAVAKLREEVRQLRDSLARKNETIKELEGRCALYAENLAVAVQRIGQLEQDLEREARKRESTSDQEHQRHAPGPPRARGNLRSVPRAEPDSE